MKIIAAIFLAALIPMIGGAIYFRTVPDDPNEWHVDPLTATKPDTPNSALIRPEGGDATPEVFPVSPERLAEAIDGVALAEPRTARLAGGPQDLWMTYVQRSGLWGFPDYISVKVIPTEGGATWAAFSRARFGTSDLGVNAKRLARWRRELEDRLAP